MKIFAKRTKKVTTPSVKKENKESASADKNFASDKIVEEELLKKEPSELNSKERRMLKRYQERKAQEGASNGEGNKDIVKQEEVPAKTEEDKPAQEDSSDSESENEDEHEEKPAQEDSSDPVSENEDENEDESEASEPDIKEPDAKKIKVDDEQPKRSEEAPKDLESALEPSVLEKLNSKQRRKLSRMLSRTGDEEASVADVQKEANNMLSESSNAGTEQTSDKTTESAQNNEESGSMEMTKVQKLLEGLNSKQKRKLTRRLEREGDSCLAEVKEEAEHLLGVSSSAGTNGKQTEGNDASAATEDSTLSGKKRKRRRRSAVDLSNLTPEERLRREEQRRMQKEAAERREDGEDNSSKFSHPLNSERRRANRRKPKWKPKKAIANERKVEHNSSGYQARKSSRD